MPEVEIHLQQIEIEATHQTHKFQWPLCDPALVNFWKLQYSVATDLALLLFILTPLSLILNPSVAFALFESYKFRFVIVSHTESFPSVSRSLTNPSNICCPMSSRLIISLAEVLVITALVSKLYISSSSVDSNGLRCSWNTALSLTAFCVIRVRDSFPPLNSWCSVLFDMFPVQYSFSNLCCTLDSSGAIRKYLSSDFSFCVIPTFLKWLWVRDFLVQSHGLGLLMWIQRHLWWHRNSLLWTFVPKSQEVGVLFAALRKCTVGEGVLSSSDGGQ